MKTCVFVLLMVLVAAPGFASVEWVVTSSDESSIRLRVTADGARLVQGSDGLFSAVVPGAHVTGEPGTPGLPADARWIAIPALGEATLQVLSVELSDLGTGRIRPVPTPGLSPDEGDGPRLVEELRFSDDYDSWQVDEGDVVALGAPVSQRRHRMVSVAVRPVLYDAATRRVRAVESVEFEITWPRPLQMGALPAVADATILRSVLNPEQAREWAALSPRQQAILEAAREPAAIPREQPAAGIGVLDPAMLAADGIRLRVDHTGIVRVTAADLEAGGGLPLDVPRSWLRVVQMRGSEPGSAEYPRPLLVDVPAHFFGAPDEAQNLSSADEIYFHALRVEDDADTLTAGPDRALPALPWGESSTTDIIPPRYTGDHFNADNVYWVYLMEPPAGGWARMAAESTPPSGGNPQPGYVRREHFEGNLGYRDEPRDPWVERYAWNRRDELDVVRAVQLVSPAPGQDLVVRWAAGGHISGSPVPVDFSVRQGGIEQPLLSLNMNTNGIMTDWSSTVPAAPFGSGVLEFRMRRLFNGGDVWVNTFLDHVELEYPALYRAQADELRFPTGSGDAVVDAEVEGYSRADLLCFDVTDPRQPRWIDLAAANVEDRSGGGTANYALSLQLSQPTGERTLVASPRVRYTRIGRASIERDDVADIFDRVDDLQVLAIGPEQFRTQGERWIAWREQTYQGTGWNFGYVDVQQIYDQFSGGLQSPWAIKAFVEWAWLNWDAIALVLVGDANEDVLDAGGRAGANHVPPSLHLQSFTGSRELLASDKWYGLFGYTPVGNNRYPVGLAVTSDLVVGRFAVPSETALATLIDKIMAYEQSDPNQEWRRRTLWVADDAYSSDLIGAGSGCYRYQSIEEDFLTSQQASAAVVEGSLDQTISAAVQDADVYTRDCRVGEACESLGGVRTCFDANHRREFVDRWNEGWLWLSYQGHANFNVLGHENLILASSVAQLRNDGRPFVFFGMGCHVSDFLRSEEGADGASLGELVLWLPSGGAIATYGSSGFEFLTPNATFMEILGETMFDRRVADSPVFGSTLRNQWILGDVMARGELETLALRNSLNIFKGDEMIAQYNLLGDPLLRMDAGSPRMEVARGGQPLPAGADIDADAGLDVATIAVDLVDESGLDRIEITDSVGRDYAAVIPKLGGADPRQETVSIDLPIYPQAYSVEIAGFDAARNDLRQTVQAFNVPLPIDFLVDGEPVTPGSTLEFESGVPRVMDVSFTAPVDLVEADVAIDFPGVDVTGLSVTGGPRDWTVGFDAIARATEDPGALSLVLKGIATELLTSGEGPAAVPPVVLRHVVFPNPVTDTGRVVVQVQGAVDRARLSVYDLAGNEVSSQDVVIGAIAPDGGDGARIALEFRARDRKGDELANGTYFYRVSVEGPAGSARSDMGRLLVMR